MKLLYRYFVDIGITSLRSSTLLKPVRGNPKPLLRDQGSTFEATRSPSLFPAACDLGPCGNQASHRALYPALRTYNCPRDPFRRPVGLLKALVLLLSFVLCALAFLATPRHSSASAKTQCLKATSSPRTPLWLRPTRSTPSTSPRRSLSEFCVWWWLLDIMPRGLVGQLRLSKAQL